MTRKEELEAALKVEQDLYKEHKDYRRYVKAIQSLNTELIEIRREEQRIAEENRVAEKMARLASEGKTKEAAVARVAEIQTQLTALLTEAENICRDFEIECKVNASEMEVPLVISGTPWGVYYQGLHSNWDSSYC